MSRRCRPGLIAQGSLTNPPPSGGGGGGCSCFPTELPSESVCEVEWDVGFETIGSMLLQDFSTDFPTSYYTANTSGHWVAAGFTDLEVVEFVVSTANPNTGSQHLRCTLNETFMGIGTMLVPLAGCTPPVGTWPALSQHFTGYMSAGDTINWEGYFSAIYDTTGGPGAIDAQGVIRLFKFEAGEWSVDGEVFDTDNVESSGSYEQFDCELAAPYSGAYACELRWVTAPTSEPGDPISLILDIDDCSVVLT